MITVNNHAVSIEYKVEGEPELVVKNAVGEVTDGFPVFGSVEVTVLDQYGPCVVWERSKRIRPFRITQAGVFVAEDDVYLDVMPD